MNFNIYKKYVKKNPQPKDLAGTTVSYLFRRAEFKNTTDAQTNSTVGEGQGSEPNIEGGNETTEPNIGGGNGTSETTPGE